MGDLLIRNVPEHLKKQLELAARREGTSLSAKSIDLLRRSLAEEVASAAVPPLSAWDVLRPIMYVEGLDTEAEEFAKIMEEIEAERKRDFGRPIDLG